MKRLLLTKDTIRLLVGLELERARGGAVKSGIVQQTCHECTADLCPSPSGYCPTFEEDPSCVP